jgi:hypothetical protein
VASNITYALDAPDPNSPLADPSHAGLHQAENTAINLLSQRIGVFENAAPELASDLQQARLAAHEWPVRGTLMVDNRLLMPVIWNLTGHAVQFDAAKLSVFIPGGTLSSGDYDIGNTQSSILGAGKLVIPAGEYSSVTVTADGAGGGFVGNMPIDTYVAAVLTQVGSLSAPGADLTIQLNRLL